MSVTRDELNEYLWKNHEKAFKKHQDTERNDPIGPYYQGKSLAWYEISYMLRQASGRTIETDVADLVDWLEAEFHRGMERDRYLADATAPSARAYMEGINDAYKAAASMIEDIKSLV